MKKLLVLMLFLGLHVMVVYAKDVQEPAAAIPALKPLTDQEVRALRMAYFELAANPVYLDEDSDFATKIRFLDQLDVSGTPAGFRQAFRKMVKQMKVSGSLRKTEAIKKHDSVLNSYFEHDDAGCHHLSMMVGGYYNPLVMPTPPIVIIVDEEGNKRIDEEAARRHQKNYREHVYDEMCSIVPKIPLPRERNAIALVYINMLFDYKMFEIMQHQTGKVSQPQNGINEFSGAEYGDAYFKWWQELDGKLDLEGCPESFAAIIRNLITVMKDMAVMSPDERKNYQMKPGMEANLPKALYWSGVAFYEMDQYIKEQEKKAFSQQDLEALKQDPPWPDEMFEKVTSFYSDLEKDMISKIKSGYFKYRGGFDDYYIDIPGF